MVAIDVVIKCVHKSTVKIEKKKEKTRHSFIYDMEDNFTTRHWKEKNNKMDTYYFDGGLQESPKQSRTWRKFSKKKIRSTLVRHCWKSKTSRCLLYVMLLSILWVEKQRCTQCVCRNTADRTHTRLVHTHRWHTHTACYCFLDGLSTIYYYGWLNPFWKSCATTRVRSHRHKGNLGERERHTNLKRSSGPPS